MTTDLETDCCILYLFIFINGSTLFQNNCLNLAYKGKFKGLEVSLLVHAHGGLKLFVGTSDTFHGVSKWQKAC